MMERFVLHLHFRNVLQYDLNLVFACGSPIFTLSRQVNAAILEANSRAGIPAEWARSRPLVSGMSRRSPSPLWTRETLRSRFHQALMNTSGIDDVPLEELLMQKQTNKQTEIVMSLPGRYRPACLMHHTGTCSVSSPRAARRNVSFLSSGKSLGLDRKKMK